TTVRNLKSLASAGVPSPGCTVRLRTIEVAISRTRPETGSIATRRPGCRIETISLLGWFGPIWPLASLVVLFSVLIHGLTVTPLVRRRAPPEDARADGQDPPA
ncbi:hypothetical protein, partial [uncultured Jannaschia sp.]|uniref:hypothetical protein n=1 Tax=uncultured Jannaschia sp. TaxID=293347 RepID=UPI002608521C